MLKRTLKFDEKFSKLDVEKIIGMPELFNFTPTPSPRGF